MKKLILFTLLFIGSLMPAQNIIGLPRTIQVEGEKTINMGPDELDLEIQYSNMDNKTNAKLPIDKLIAQLKLFMTKRAIPIANLEEKIDPTICTPNSRTCIIKKIPSKDFAALREYIANTPFVTSTSIVNKRIFKKTLENLSNQLIYGAIDNAKARAEQVALNLQEKIHQFHSFKSNTMLLSNEYDYETSNVYEHFEDKVDSIKFTYSIQLEFSLETNADEKMVVFPRTIYTWGTSYSLSQHKSGEFTFNFSLVDYEEGAPKEAFQKNKERLIQNLLQKGVKKEQLIEKNNEYNFSSSEDTYLSTTFEIRLLNNNFNLSELHKMLSNDKNVSSLHFTGTPQNAIQSQEINSKLTEKSILAAKLTAQKIAAYLGVEIKRVFDFTDYSLDKYFYNESSNQIPINSELEFVNRKDVYISYELK